MSSLLTSARGERYDGSVLSKPHNCLAMSFRVSGFVLRKPRFILACIVVSLVVLLVAFGVDARPGGGNSYTGRSSSGGSSYKSSSRSSSGGSSYKSGSRSSYSGSDSDGERCNYEYLEDGLRYCGTRKDIGLSKSDSESVWDSVGQIWLGGNIVLGSLYLCWVYIVPGLFRNSRKSWTVGVSERTFSAKAVRALDPDFSIVLFEDFLYSLYAEVQRSRGGDKLDRMSAYLSPLSIVSLRNRGSVSEVSRVIVGSMRVNDFSVTGASPSMIRVGVLFEANFTETEGGSRVVYANEQWNLSRSSEARSRVPGQINVLTCPSCGAPRDVIISGRCGYCGKTVNNGAFDWIVDSIVLIQSVSRGPMLGSTVEERGTDLPTVYDPDLPQASIALSAKDPQMRWEDFEARFRMVFAEFQVAWSARDLKSMRPFLSDCFFQTQSYWIEAFKQQRLRNITERARIIRIELVKISMDRFYDAITIRFWATGLDYTVDDDNRLVCGSTSRERPFSEYWTFIRGSDRRGASYAVKACSNCGAPLDVNMAGFCEYCRVKVTSGAFDWVLSKIEQDDSYRG